MAVTGLATAFETKIDSLLGQWVNGVSGAFITALAPLAAIAFTVYVILMGWQIMRGETNEPVPHIVKRLLKLAVIGAIAVGPLGYYQTYVIGLSNAATGALVATIAGGGVNGGAPATTIGNMLDGVMLPYTNLWNALAQNFTSHLIPSFALILAGLFVAVAEFFVVVVSLGFYLLAKIELALCLAVGPVFVLLAAFESTAEWTKRWIGQLWHYSLQVALMAAAISMLQSILVKATTDAYNNYQNNGAGSVFGDVLAIFCISLCVAVVVYNIGALTQALTGAVGSLGHSSVQSPSGAAAAAVRDKATSVAMDAVTGGASRALRIARSAGGKGGSNQLTAGGGSAGGAQPAGSAGNIPAAQASVLAHL
jgi:type IV secretion system protein VirB6